MKILAFLLSIIPGLALAQSVATVVETRPRLVTIQERECRIEQIPVTTGSAPGTVFDGTGAALKGDGDALAGAIIGGVIGNQFGKGDGKKAATVAGVIIGSNMAHGTANAQGGTHTRYVNQEVCRDVPRQVHRGDIVTFEYRGRRFTVTFD